MITLVFTLYNSSGIDLHDPRDSTRLSRMREGISSFHRYAKGPILAQKAHQRIVTGTDVCSWSPVSILCDREQQTLDYASSVF